MRIETSLRQQPRQLLQPNNPQ
ncbi:hypothetical protein PL8927_760188 [Planktothrix serta PCC 8927]|uniref:Uncharacterized protein n=1 Tax=Planktothrix serta PCC 8927 TaxID=671068 RepID=A0A7Z9BVC3_9CYAN|nr:hypothetical protein PL8927_760188 [Planktothrix serta PCC 8927]